MFHFEGQEYFVCHSLANYHYTTCAHTVGQKCAFIALNWSSVEVHHALMGHMV